MYVFRLQPIKYVLVVVSSEFTDPIGNVIRTVHVHVHTYVMLVHSAYLLPTM